MGNCHRNLMESCLDCRFIEGSASANQYNRVDFRIFLSERLLQLRANDVANPG
jgi:hypothetical protein